MVSYLLPTTGSTAWNENNPQGTGSGAEGAAVPGRGWSRGRRGTGALTHARSFQTSWEREAPR